MAIRPCTAAAVASKVAALLQAPELASHATAGIVPVVVEGRPSLRSTRVDLVSTDDVLGADIAVSHLVDFGHRAIAHIAGITKLFSNCCQRI